MSLPHSVRLDIEVLELQQASATTTASHTLRTTVHFSTAARARHVLANAAGLMVAVLATDSGSRSSASTAASLRASIEAMSPGYWRLKQNWAVASGPGYF